MKKMEFKFKNIKPGDVVFTSLHLDPQKVINVDQFSFTVRGYKFGFDGSNFQNAPFDVIAIGVKDEEHDFDKPTFAVFYCKSVGCYVFAQLINYNSVNSAYFKSLTEDLPWYASHPIDDEDIYHNFLIAWNVYQFKKELPIKIISKNLESKSLYNTFVHE